MGLYIQSIRGATFRIEFRRLALLDTCCRNTWVRLSKATKIQLPGLATWVGAENIAGASTDVYVES